MPPVTESNTPKPPCSMDRQAKDQDWSDKVFPRTDSQAPLISLDEAEAKKTPSSHGRVLKRNITLDAPKQLRSMWEAGRGEASCHNLSKETVRDSRKEFTHLRIHVGEPMGEPRTWTPSLGL